MGADEVIELKIKPLSVNEAYKGRKYSTPKKKQFERDVMALLPDSLEIPERILICFEWGFSSAASDWDNPIKPFQDCLQKKYGFNDSKIFTGVASKEKVKKGFEYIHFKIYDFDRYQVEINLRPN